MQSTGEGLKLNLSTGIIILCLDIDIKVLHWDVLALTFALSFGFIRFTKQPLKIVFIYFSYYYFYSMAIFS
jgi:hypothetical protein